MQNALSAQQESVFTLDAESVNEIADALRMIPFQSTYLKNIRVVDRDHNILYDLGYDDISRERFAEVLRVIDETAGYDSLQYIRTYRNYDKIVLGMKNIQIRKRRAAHRLHSGLHRRELCQRRAACQRFVRRRLQRYASE